MLVVAAAITNARDGAQAEAETIALGNCLEICPRHNLFIRITLPRDAVCAIRAGLQCVPVEASSTTRARDAALSCNRSLRSRTTERRDWHLGCGLLPRPQAEKHLRKGGATSYHLHAR